MHSETASADSAGVPARRPQVLIAGLTLAGLAMHAGIRFLVPGQPSLSDGPLYGILLLGGVPLLFRLVAGLFRGEFSSDLLAGISIVTSVILGEYLAGSLVVLMLSGGQALEGYAVRRASSVLAALARRAPSVAHRQENGAVVDVALESVSVGDQLIVFPHETCPVDGTVVTGQGTMDESYLTGEPYQIEKTPGSAVLSGAINGEAALTIRADRRALDSRYAKIMRVMQDAEQRRPRLRRLGDQLGALYTPLALAVALGAWAVSGDPLRFLAVLVVATPCPLLIAIPVAIIGAISLAARRGIIIKDPAVLEKIDECRVAIFDKTGTLTYGRPLLTEIVTGPGFTRSEVLGLVASLERYSKHPLARAVQDAAVAERLALAEVSLASEEPGRGLRGTVSGRTVQVTGRSKLAASDPALAAGLPPEADGLECIVLVDGRLAGTLRFRDQVRTDGKPFVSHLTQRHHFERILLVSGDRAREVHYLAEIVGIPEVFAGQSPEQKLEIVRLETAGGPTLFVGDGVNDAPALAAASVGVGFGQNSDVTTEAAGAVILGGTLRQVDEFLHLGQRLRRIALQSAVGGMALSLLGMAVAAAGYLPPVAGALFQEVIDVVAVLNALRMALPPRSLTDY